MKKLLTGALFAAAMSVATIPAAAETDTVRFARQIDIAYMPLALMEHDKLVEKHAGEAGIGDLKVEWTHMRGGSNLNDALLSGQVDYAAGGVPPMIVLWDRTRGNANVKGVAPISSLCFKLNTNQPDIKSLSDFTDEDRIAVPSIKVSIQAIVLQMAAEQAFGEGKHDALDHITVAMSHPDGVVALTSGGSITAHFTTPPFMNQELQAEGISTVLTSCDVFGSKPSFSVLWSTEAFRKANPKVYGAVLAALEEATKMVNENPERAAEIFIEMTESKMPKDFVLDMIKEAGYSTTPSGTTTYANFMHKIELINEAPSSWKGLFFENIHNKPGS